jgi:hypothetical protein
MKLIKMVFRVIFYTALALFSIFAWYIVDDTTLSRIAFVLIVMAFCFEWLGDRSKAKEKEAAKLQQLIDRVTYLERQQVRKR